MRKKLLLLITLFVFTGIVTAKNVPLDKARLIAKNFYYERANQTAKVNYDAITLKEVYTETRNSNLLYYVFNVNEDQGFVIISADDNAAPIIGYSYKGKYSADNQPQTFIDFMDYMAKQISFTIENQLEGTKYTGYKWAELDYTTPPATIKDVKEVEPMIINTWNQSWPYNADCPEDAEGSGGHVYAGCVATSFAMVMKYWDHPETGTGSESYTAWGYGNQSANFGNTTYKWTHMPNSCGSKNYEEVAKLQYHCGVAVNMYYSATGSGSQIENIEYGLKNYFRYDNSCDTKSKSSYSTTGWLNLLKNELDAGHPMVYSGSPEEGSGHAWNCDGYQGDDHFHFNWGWSGAYNGFYYLNDLSPGANDFTYWQGAVLSIFPEGTWPVYCTGTNTIDGYEGTFDDGSSNTDYQNNIDCKWLIDPPCGNNIELEFDLFDLEDNDMVVIYNGSTTSDEVLFTFTGADPPTSVDNIMANEGGMLVNFITDGSGTATGWAASYDVDFCYGTKTLTGTEGSVADGSGPCDYIDGKICTWEIEPENAEIIHITFTEFDLGYFKHYVQISDVNGLVEKFDSDNPPTGPVEASTYASVRFSTVQTDGTVGEGWALDYTTTLTGIEETENEPFGVNVYPNPFNNDTKISYDIPENSDVALTLTNIVGKEIGIVYQLQVSGKNSINLSEIYKNITKGIYFINISTGNHSVTKKIISL